jgi:FkbM family methyltransferase
MFLTRGRSIGERVVQYSKELLTCFRLGAGWRDRLTLAAAGLEFHLSNLMNRPPASRATRYQIRLAGIRNIQLRRRSGDFFIFHEIFTNRYYKLPDGLAAPAPTVIVDLGANIGLATLFLADRFRGARHVCVEPNPANVAVLRANGSFLGERLTIVEGAASARSGEARFADSNWSGGGHLVENGASSRAVRCVTVDEILSTFGLEAIDILKVNIEGAEKEMFSRAPAWLSKVGCIMIELHNGYSADDFRADVAPHGFRVLPTGSAFGNAVVVAVRATAACGDAAAASTAAAVGL